VGIIGKNPLFFAFFFPMAIDGVLTLIGQDPSYWSGGKTNEASPAYFILQISPWLFVLGSAAWITFWYWAVRKLKEPLNLIMTLLFVIGHSFGSSSWIVNITFERGFFKYGDQASNMIAWGLIILYFVLIAIVAANCLRIYFRKDNLSSN